MHRSPTEVGSELGQSVVGRILYVAIYSYVDVLSSSIGADDVGLTPGQGQIVGRSRERDVTTARDMGPHYFNLQGKACSRNKHFHSFMPF